GMSGSDVRQLQTRLQALYYYTGQITDYFGNDTEDAVRAFQMRNGLTANGVVGYDTYTRLYSNNPNPNPTNTPSQWRELSKGMSGSDVRQLQTRLQALYYYMGKITDYFGDDTENAVRAFQLNNGLTANGVVGQDTHAHLYSNNPNPNPTNTPGPVVAPCGIAGHTLTDGRNHAAAPCGIPGHFVCDGKEHVLASCHVSNHWKCTNTTAELHEQKLPCGHYACESGTHGLLPCGHYACTPGDHSLLPCGHYACQLAPNGRTHNLLPCGKPKHFDCCVSAPELHDASGKNCPD
ncbi:MAG: peptidoglycan-binding protein, partial [Clostridia bacterium]